VKLHNVVPMISVTNLDETIRFYSGVLGFACLKGIPEWACLTKDGVEFMICLPNQHEPFEKSLFTGSFYFRTDDVDGLWNSVKDKATVVYPVETFDYGMREFAIRDNNGYILQFGKEVGAQ
jgi:uncharacterized glyoxalase superfamily protein PhnB